MGNAIIGDVPMSEQIAISVNEAAKKISCGRTMIYSLINSGRIKTAKIGDRRLVVVSSLHDLVSSSTN